MTRETKRSGPVPGHLKRTEVERRDLRGEFAEQAHAVEFRGHHTGAEVTLYVNLVTRAVYEEKTASKPTGTRANKDMHRKLDSVDWIH